MTKKKALIDPTDNVSPLEAYVLAGAILQGHLIRAGEGSISITMVALLVD